MNPETPVIAVIENEMPSPEMLGELEEASPKIPTNLKEDFEALPIIPQNKQEEEAEASKSVGN